MPSIFHCFLYTVACLGGGLGCSSTPLAQAVSYIIGASGSGPASPGFSKRDYFFSKYYAWHGTSRCFVGTVTCHCLCTSRDIIDRRWTRKCSRIEMGVWLVVSAAPWRAPWAWTNQSVLVNKVEQYFHYIPNAPELISERVRIQKFPGGKPPDPPPWQILRALRTLWLISRPLQFSLFWTCRYFSSPKALAPAAAKKVVPTRIFCLSSPLAKFLEPPLVHDLLQ